MNKEEQAKLLAEIKPLIPESLYLSLTECIEFLEESLQDYEDQRQNFYKIVDKFHALTEELRNA